MKKNKELGFTPALVLILVGVLVLLVSAGSYYLLKSSGRAREVKTLLEKTEATPAPVSSSDQSDDLERELNETDVGDLNKDFGEIDSSASSL